jgi:DNA-binding response OmpR family regulator
MIEDDIEIYHLVKSFAKDLEINYVASLTEASLWLSKNTPELVLLDVELPDGNGVDFLTKNRALFEESRIGVIMLTSHGEIGTKLESFEMGVLDYVQKPFIPIELIARIRANIKKVYPRTKDLMKNDIIVKFSSNQVFVGTKDDQKSVELSPLEFKLLVFFMQNEERVFTREQLMDMVWGNEFGLTDRNVDQHISKLRKKINSQFYHVKTIHGTGYCWQKYDRPS